MNIQRAASIKNGIISNIIIVDINSHFAYNAAGYKLADARVAIGWMQQDDGYFLPPDRGIVAVLNPSVTKDNVEANPDWLLANPILPGPSF